MNIKDLTLDELGTFLKKLGLPGYRAEQIYSWIYQKNVGSWDAMSNLPVSLRQKLIELNVSLGCLDLVASDRSPDGTVKYLFELDDGERIESVYLPDEDRHTVCFSTQVGCGMKCSFCATGQNGIRRNLTVGEIVDQPLRISEFSGAQITNLVAMGQGEPLLNYDNLIKAIRILNHSKGLGLGARRFTVSTCGIIPGMLKLIEEQFQVNLAVSLHAADDQLRNELMPINRKYSLPELLEACKIYTDKTGRRITFEYTLIENINDRAVDCSNLIRLLQGMLCHVNLILFNPVPGSSFKRSRRQQVQWFAAELNKAHIETTIRKERGTSLTAACGQLQGKAQTEVRHL